MNGVHDMGGMHGMGPVVHEKNEPVFHERWEARTYALNRAMASWGKWNIDAARHQIELIPPGEYLRMSYYEKWFTRLCELLINRGMATRSEVEAGKAAEGSVKAIPALTLEMVPLSVDRGLAPNHEPSTIPLFEVGQPVRARNMHPAGHTRLPRYARGKVGTIVRDHGVYNFPDTNAHFSGEKRQHVYSVRFTARELWGEDASMRHFVYIDMWETILNSLEPVSESFDSLALLQRLPRDAGGPVFAEPWQAQAFALAVKLSQQGHFTWKEWAEALACELKAAEDRGEPDDGSHYYEHWLAALERLVTAKGLAGQADLLARKEAWAEAYRHTPHGKPVELAASVRAPERS